MLIFNVILNSILFLDDTEKPQTLLFSATLPPWVQKTAEKYMSEDKKIVDLIGDQELKASETIQVLFQFAKLNLKALILLKFLSFGKCIVTAE